MKKYWLAMSVLILMGSQAQAIVSIDITRGNVDPLPIALPEFFAKDGGDGQRMGLQLTDVIQQDLEGSGLFRAINKNSFIQEIKGSDTVPQFSDWRQVGASALVTGGVDLSGTGLTSEFRLWDVLAQQQIAGRRYNTVPENWRRSAHMVADEIYKRLTGESGYFDTRIVYIAESGPEQRRVKRLAVMDQDGANHRFLTDGKSLVLTPRFSPTSQEVIYLSYQKKIPKVYIRNIDKGTERLLGNFHGMSFAPRFAPDGKSVLMSVSDAGNSDIYALDLVTGAQRRLTYESAIDTSPSYSPDAKQIVFNSDRGGSQQLYVMDKNGHDIKRISFGAGKYGTPVWSPRGDYIAFTKIHNGSFYIGVMYPDGTGERLLTESFMDEGPTWAPNGRILMFARQIRIPGSNQTKWGIYSIDLTGRNEKRMPTPGEASDPAWSPLL
jgi:TolB protein